MQLRTAQIEAWALRIVECIKAGQAVEDARVELKREWTDPEKAARQIAGHANSARGESILWVIGIDEKFGPVTFASQNLADWYAKVKAQFDGPYPPVTDVNVFVDGFTIVALLFETDRAPFVVRNPVAGKPGGGSVALEVPWRENTSVRSATHNDLLQLLIPFQRLPEFEVLNARFHVHTFGRESHFSNFTDYEWKLDLILYVVPSDKQAVVIPFHRCEVSLEIENVISRTLLDNIHLVPPGVELSRNDSRGLSLTIRSTPSEVIINGPGVLNLTARLDRSFLSLAPGTDTAQAIIKLLPVHAERAVVLNVPVRIQLPHSSFRWEPPPELDEELPF